MVVSSVLIESVSSSTRRRLTPRATASRSTSSACPGNPHRHRVEERAGEHLDSPVAQTVGERPGVPVGATGDRGEPGGAVPDRIHAGHHREQDLRGADVGGRLLAPDVLLAGLQRQPVCGVAGGVDGDADEAAGHLPLEALPDRHVARVRTPEAHGDAEPLAAADGDVGAPLPRRRDERQGEEVGGRGDEGAVLVGGGREGPEVAQLAVGAGVLDDDAEDVTASGGVAQGVGAVDVGEVGDRHLDPERRARGSGSRRSTAAACAGRRGGRRRRRSWPCAA